MGAEKKQWGGERRREGKRETDFHIMENNGQTIMEKLLNYWSNLRSTRRYLSIYGFKSDSEYYGFNLFQG